MHRTTRKILIQIIGGIIAAGFIVLSGTWDALNNIQRFAMLISIIVIYESGLRVGKIGK